jgi:hypothetical protein
MTALHENLSRQETVRPSSNRTFGIVFAIFLAVVAFGPLVHGRRVHVWAALLAGLFCLAALAAPKLLAPLNRVWTALGTVLHHVANPIILGILFYLVFTPFGWLLRWMGKDFLRLKKAPDDASYWILRQPPGPDPESMSRQF